MDFINIIGTFFDNSIEHVVALAHLIKDLRLNKNQQDINEDIYNKLSESNSSIELLEENVEKITQDLNEFSEQTTNKFNEYDLAIEQINLDISKILNTDLDIESINQEITNVKQDVENIEQDIQGINQNIETTNLNIDTISLDIDTINLNIDEITLNIESTSLNINKINLDIENLNSNVDNLLESNELTNLTLLDRIDALIKENRRINSVIDNIKANEFKHIILTQTLYDALLSYLRNTIYLIVEKEITGHSVFGDTFPFILGGTFSRFGDTFPFTLGGISSKFGEPFPITLD